MSTAQHRSTRRRFAALVASIAVALGAASSGAAAAGIEETFKRHSPDSKVTVDHAPFDMILKTYVGPGKDGLNRVAYARLKAKGQAALRAYIRSLEKVDVTKLARKEQFAFWANLYNARTLDIVVEKYPVASIKDINLGGSLLTIVTGGPWKAKVVKVNGLALSLDDIEHVILRGLFKDPRVHYAVNCASVGCPNLLTEAFTGAKLEAQLDAGARAYVNHPRGIKVVGGKVVASGIYKWFIKDFGGTEAGVLAHVRKYAAPQLADRLKGKSSVSEYAYDWSLNDAKL